MCHQVISRNQPDQHIAGRLLTERGDQFIVERGERVGDHSSELPDIEQALTVLSQRLTEDDADVPALLEQLNALKELRSKARHAQPSDAWRVTARKVQEEWAKCSTDDLQRREVLAGQAEKVVITRGKGGRYLDPNRVAISWVEEPVMLPVGSGSVIHIQGR